MGYQPERRDGVIDFAPAFSHVANVALENALDLERLMIRAGVLLPIGSSLLIVARRPRI